MLHVPTKPLNHLELSKVLLWQTARAIPAILLAYACLLLPLKPFLLSLSLSGLLKGLTAFILLLNAKALPFVWHLRIFSCFAQRQPPNQRKPPRRAQQQQQQQQQPPQDQGPEHSAHDHHPLFSPHVTRSHAPLLELDYNLHKSNSTYFSDLDVSRTHLLLSLFRPGLAALGAQLGREKTAAGNGKGSGGAAAPAKVSVTVALGGASCIFRRAIPPYGRYRMASRVLAWDRKWLYVATHFLEDGDSGDASAAPSTTAPGAGDGGPNSRGAAANVPYATALARYVVKAGRLTVAPARLIQAAGLLGDDDDDEADEVERARAWGLKYAQGFAAMDELSGAFFPPR